MKFKKKKIHIELRQFCLIYFPESTHSMELRMTNFTGYTYYISLYRSRNRKGTLFVSFLFHILFFLMRVSLILLYVSIYVVCCARIYPVQTMLSDSCPYFFFCMQWKMIKATCMIVIYSGKKFKQRNLPFLVSNSHLEHCLYGMYENWCSNS